MQTDQGLSPKYSRLSENYSKEVSAKDFEIQFCGRSNGKRRAKRAPQYGPRYAETLGDAWFSGGFEACRNKVRSRSKSSGMSCPRGAWLQ